ncbi:MAG: TonB family protein, partial [Thermoanaerobaculia bacterium]
LLPAPDFAVTEAHDGEEGLSAFSSSRFDLVVLSGMLPRLPSAEVIREIRRKGGAAAPPILLMVSGYKGSNKKADAQRVGAFDILVKPFDDQSFRQAVQQAVGSTDAGARTMKIAVADVAASSQLTSEDIFSDVLQDVGEQVSRPAPAAAPRPAAAATLPPAAAEASDGRPRFSTDADIDRMIKDKLSSLRAPQGKAPAGLPGAGAGAESSRADPDRFGQYEILEKIASGGMADVFKARRTGVEGFQKIVAIKKILPHLADNEQFIAMFADEAKLAAQLSHPNIVHIYDLGKIDAGGYFIAMEYVEGRELRAILQTDRGVTTPMPVPLAIYVASKVASALDYAQRRRDADGRDLAIVHRDVSPQNILISYEGDIKLCDFGIAKAASKASTTQSGALKGKVQYMSPEQAWGLPIDRRSDLFSLGSVLFEMLTGEKLFRGDTDLTVLEKVRAAEAPAPSSINPEVPRSLDAILAKTLAPAPDDRYSNASDLLRDLESVLYSYTPAPGSADLAIYLHRQQAEEAAAAEANAREPARSAPAEPPKKQRSKASPVARRLAGSAPKFVVEPGRPAPVPEPAAAARPPDEGAKSRPAPGAVYGAARPAAAQIEKRSRAVLYVAILVEVAALAGVAWWILIREAPSRKAPVELAKTPPALAVQDAAVTAGAAGAPITPAAAAAPAGYDAKAVEAEVRRQVAARRKELQKTLEPPASPAEGAAAPEPTVLPTRAEPTPAAAGETPARPAPVLEADWARGDIVGPGPGVIEPALLAPPRINYPPVARRQGVSGRVIVLVLVDESGAVSEARLQQGVPSEPGINEAVLDGVRKSRFRSATKNGVAVKMWRTVVVDVQP